MNLNKVKNHQVHYKIYCIADKLIQDKLDKIYTDNSGELYNIHNLIHVSVYKLFDYKKSVEDI
jgi:hypothetical protein